MDLAKFAQMPRDKGFLKFTANDNVKFIRFLYPTTVGVDDELGIPVRYQEFDSATKTVVYDTPGSKPFMTLKVAVYSSKTEYTIRTWSRRADTFGTDILMPLWENAGGRICDTVYKVSCTNAGTLDAKFSFFPLKDSDTYAMPSLSEGDEQVSEESVQSEHSPKPVAEKVAPPNPTMQSQQGTAPKKKMNFWDV